MRVGSLRVRLAALIVIAVALPLLVVALVAVDVSGDVDIVVSGPASVDVEQVSTRLDPAAERWVWGTVSILLVLGAVAAWWVAGRIVRPIHRMRDTAEAVEATDLGARIRLDRGADELVELAGSFDRMLDRLQAAASAQRDFVARTSHELRTPLAVLQTNVDLLHSDPDADLEAHREATTVTRTAVVRLRRLVDDLLLASRAEARAIDRAPVSAGEVLAAVRAARTDEEQVRLSVPASMSEAVAGMDAASVERAVGNLVDNALAHAEGPVALGVGHLGEWLAIGVRDAGDGVAAADAASIFEPYVSRSSGTGLGLAIVDQVARAHGGVVTVRSEPGYRTTFILWLPASSSAVPAGIDPGAHTHVAELERRLVWGGALDA